ncbi:hypothetical protein O6H91_08G055400 [Diphasiastrum complanatum]|uniref:Uncharacterized protein n=1 Tax=Diphasiastrum complanatum TaxID=34168 RepID=A0ACC2CXQ9_DIPCM|nr:hypothetical protein O6H91_08G055400 [Diphasiastrum complanatum]
MAEKSSMENGLPCSTLVHEYLPENSAKDAISSEEKDVCRFSIFPEYLPETGAEGVVKSEEKNASSSSFAPEYLPGTSAEGMERSEENAASSSSFSPDESNRRSDKVLSNQGSRDSTEVIAAGIASILGPVVTEFDARVEGAIKSQNALESSIDRLTRELDKLLEDTPLPFVAQHAARLSLVRKRVLSLTSTLQIIQGRIDNIGRILSTQASTSAPKLKHVRHTPPTPENQYKPRQMRSLSAGVPPVTTSVESIHNSNYGNRVPDRRLLLMSGPSASSGPQSSDSSIAYTTCRDKHGEQSSILPSRLRETGSFSKRPVELIEQNDSDHRREYFSE